MPSYITTEADLNFPVPNAERVAQRVRAMYDGTHPVNARALADEFGVGVGAIEAVLERAARAGLVRQELGQGWVPLNT
jgi:DNA-binding GntR family transcriptional regulator